MPKTKRIKTFEDKNRLSYFVRSIALKFDGIPVQPETKAVIKEMINTEIDQYTNRLVSQKVVCIEFASDLNWWLKSNISVKDEISNMVH